MLATIWARAGVRSGAEMLRWLPILGAARCAECFAGCRVGCDRVSDRVPKCFAGYEIGCTIGCDRSWIGCPKRQNALPAAIWALSPARSVVRSGAEVLCWLPKSVARSSADRVPDRVSRAPNALLAKDRVRPPVRELKLFKAPNRGSAWGSTG